MTISKSRAAAVATALAVIGASVGTAQAADAPDIPGDPLTVTCAELGIPEQACNTDMVTEDMIRAMLVAGPLTGAAMAPLMEAGAFGPPGALPPPPEMTPPAEGETPTMMVPTFDAAAYADMLAGGVTRTVVVEDLGLEVSVPVIDCRYAICLPRGVSGGPAFVDWDEVEMPPMPAPMPAMPGPAPADSGEETTEAE